MCMWCIQILSLQCGEEALLQRSPLKTFDKANLLVSSCVQPARRVWATTLRKCLTHAARQELAEGVRCVRMRDCLDLRLPEDREIQA